MTNFKKNTQVSSQFNDKTGVQSRKNALNTEYDVSQKYAVHLQGGGTHSPLSHQMGRYIKSTYHLRKSGSWNEMVFVPFLLLFFSFPGYSNKTKKESNKYKKSLCVWLLYFFGLNISCSAPRDFYAHNLYNSGITPKKNGKNVGSKTRNIWPSQKRS